MKKAIILALIIISVNLTYGQSGPSNELALRIAGKMKDSLLLTNAQRDSIYSINVLLHQRKMSARQQHTEINSLQRALQLIENQRDSLYLPVLGETKFRSYKEKQGNLINGN